MTPLIRNAGLHDVGAMTRLIKQLFSIEADFAIDEDRQRKGLSLLLSGCRKHHCVKVAEVDGEVVGMCTIQVVISTAEGGNVGLVEDMIVDARFRGRGIGRLLMMHIEEWAMQHGLTRLQLLADRTNISALDFYCKINWHPTRLIGLRRKIDSP